MFSLFKSKPLSVDQEIIKLLSQLKDRSSAVRHEAARALGALALYPDNQVKIAAIPGALESLVGLLQDPTAGVRESAAGALRNLAIPDDNPVKIAAIRGALESLVGLLQDPTAGVRANAAEALSFLALHADNQVKIAAIRGTLESLGGLLQDANAGVREQAAGALWNLAKHADNRVKIAAIPGALESLAGLLQDPTEGVRENAVGASRILAVHADNQVKIAAIPGALESLVDLLQDPTPWVKGNAAEALRNLTVNANNQVKIAAIRGALESLVGLLQDPTAGVRENAAGALTNLAHNVEIAGQIERIKSGGAQPVVVAKALAALSLSSDPACSLASAASGTEGGPLVPPPPAARPAPPARPSTDLVRQLASTSSAGSASSSTSRSFSLTRYEDIQRGALIGEGGFGVVSRGKWNYIDVAIKQLRVTRLSDKALTEFQSEAELHGGLHHANVVQLYAVCLEAAKYCMVMELMSNGSLFNLLHNGRELPWSSRLSIAKDIAVGLNYLHGRGILHRDLKSLNVLLDDRMRAKLSDFGLSTLKIESSSTTTAGAKGKSAVGTVQWMAPELFKRGTKKSELSDIYALGMTLWELAARDIPFKDGDGNEAVIVDWIKSGEQEKVPADTPKTFADLISQCWAQRAEVRPLTPAIISQLDAGLDAGLAADAPACTGAGESGYRMFSH